jgi:hypothetical protein
MNLDETWCENNACNLVENMIQYTRIIQNLDELMYDDYDLDYTFSNDYNLDEDTYYENYAQRDVDLDEDYAHNTQDYDALAYRHYA